MNGLEVSQLIPIYFRSTSLHILGTKRKHLRILILINNFLLARIASYWILLLQRIF